MVLNYVSSSLLLYGWQFKMVNKLIFKGVEQTLQMMLKTRGGRNHRWTEVVKRGERTYSYLEDTGLSSRGRRTTGAATQIRQGRGPHGRGVWCDLCRLQKSGKDGHIGLLSRCKQALEAGSPSQLESVCGCCQQSLLGRKWVMGFHASWSF